MTQDASYIFVMLHEAKESGRFSAYVFTHTMYLYLLYATCTCKLLVLYSTVHDA